MILIRTRHDLATEYTYVWSESLIKIAEENNHKVVKIEGSEANFKNFNKRIKKLGPKFIFFNGHGGNDCLYDNNKEKLVNLESSDILKNTITFARACDCLAKLGGVAVEKGCDAFVGYKKKFWIPRWHKHTCRPLKDLAAKPVMECSNLVVSYLLKGKTVKESINKSHQKADELISQLIYSKEPFASATISALIHNDSVLGFEGNSNAVINEK
jgi:hypothetical protein